MDISTEREFGVLEEDGKIVEVNELPMAGEVSLELIKAGELIVEEND